MPYAADLHASRRETYSKVMWKPWKKGSDSSKLSRKVESLLEDITGASLMGDHEDALELCDDADKRARHDLDRAHIASSRAGVLVNAGDLVGARRILERATIQFDTCMPSSGWGNLGYILDKLGEFQAGAVAHRRALEALEDELGADHPRVAKQLGDLAYSYIGLGDYDAAESVLREAVRRFEASGREVFWHARALSNLGYFLLRSRREPDAALVCFDRAEALRDASAAQLARYRMPGFSSNFEVALADGRAMVMSALGRLEEAAALRAKADDWRAKIAAVAAAAHAARSGKPHN